MISSLHLLDLERLNCRHLVRVESVMPHLRLEGIFEEVGVLKAFKLLEVPGMMLGCNLEEL